MKGKILIIDDDLPILEAMQTILEDMDFTIMACENALDGEKTAIEQDFDLILIEQDFDLILIDIRMPDKNGAEVTKSIIAAKPLSNIFVITGFPGDQLTQQALENGAKGVLKKPFEIAKILDFFTSR